MLQENLEIPFKTEVLGLEVTIETLDLSDDNQIAVICTRGKSSQRIPIVNLTASKAAAEGRGMNRRLSPVAM